MTIGLDSFKIYQLTEELELEVYSVTKQFPKDERFRSVDQLRRSSSSVTNNIAEAYARFYYKEKVRGFYIAKGEAEETKRNIIRCGKKEFLDKRIAANMEDKYTLLLRLISGYIRFLRRKFQNK